MACMQNCLFLHFSLVETVEDHIPVYVYIVCIQLLSTCIANDVYTLGFSQMSG